MNSFLDAFGNDLGRQGVQVAVVTYGATAEMLFDFNGLVSGDNYADGIRFLIDNIQLEEPSIEEEPLLPKALEYVRTHVVVEPSTGHRRQYGVPTLQVLITGQVVDEAFGVAAEAFRLTSSSDYIVAYDARFIPPIDPLLSEVDRLLQQQAQLQEDTATRNTLQLLVDTDSMIVDYTCGASSGTLSSVPMEIILSRTIGQCINTLTTVAETTTTTTTITTQTTTTRETADCSSCTEQKPCRHIIDSTFCVGFLSGTATCPPFTTPCV